MSSAQQTSKHGMTITYTIPYPYYKGTGGLSGARWQNALCIRSPATLIGLLGKGGQATQARILVASPGFPGTYAPTPKNSRAAPRPPRPLALWAGVGIARVDCVGVAVDVAVGGWRVGCAVVWLCCVHMLRAVAVGVVGDGHLFIGGIVLRMSDVGGFARDLHLRIWCVAVSWAQPIGGASWG